MLRGVTEIFAATNLDQDFLRANILVASNLCASHQIPSVHGLSATLRLQRICTLQSLPLYSLTPSL
jgi:hypothetical protein